MAGWLSALAYLAVAALAAALIALVAWVLLRLEAKQESGRGYGNRIEPRADAGHNNSETSVRFAATPSPR